MCGTHCSKCTLTLFRFEDRVLVDVEDNMDNTQALKRDGVDMVLLMLVLQGVQRGNGSIVCPYDICTIMHFKRASMS